MIEIYIKEGRLSEISTWLGEPVSANRVSDGVTRLDYNSRGPAIVTERIEGRDLLSVAFPDGGWADDASCAREAFTALKKTVYCDPGDGDPNPTKVLVVDQSGENIRYFEFEKRADHDNGLNGLQP